MNRPTAEQYNKITAIIEEYIHFLDLQKGMYFDACTSFSDNKRIIEYQKARVQKRTKRGKDYKGEDIIIWTSFEDPSSPDVIHNRIIKADDAAKENSAGGLHEQQHSQATLVFIFTFWEDEIRPRLAECMLVEVSEIKSDIMGDLRILRNVILHSKGILKADRYKELKILKDIFEPNSPLVFSYKKIEQIFQLIHKEAARLIFRFTGEDESKADNIKQIAIQRFNRENE